MRKDAKWVIPKTTKIVDPRIAIAKHIGWSRPLTGMTDYSLPEPDNYNYAVFNPLPWECPIIEDQVFYYDRRLQGWWTVYYVTEEVEDEFIAWAHPLQFGLCWATPRRPTKLRHRRTLLWSRTCAVEQTSEERLFTMGYYDKLQTTYNIDISQALGTPRLNMPQGEFT